NVTPAIALVYNTASKYSKGNNAVITLYEDNYTAPVHADFKWRRVKGNRITKH
ncbi:hypothetical protein L873DRAFT_1819680, partial [Choiromyces venosus 120613-1]